MLGGHTSVYKVRFTFVKALRKVNYLHLFAKTGRVVGYALLYPR